MKKLLVTLAAVLVSASALAQGTLTFNNRSLTDPATGSPYNAAINGDTTGATAQLFLVNADGSIGAALPGTQAFRASPNQAFFTGAITVAVPGVAAGVAGTRVVVRTWQGANYDTALTRGQSSVIVLGPLGGVPPTPGATPVTPPDLGGTLVNGVAMGLTSFDVVTVPEPSTIALGLLGAAALLYRRRK